MRKPKCNHCEKRIYRFKEYAPGDCYKYTIECKCGLKIHAWTSEECELQLKKVRSESK